MPNGRQAYQQQIMQNLGQLGGVLGGIAGQRWGRGPSTQGQQLAKAAKQEGTETRVNKWFEEVMFLSPEERASRLEMDPSIKNWPRGYAYAQWLAQNMPVQQLGAAVEQMRTIPGGPAGLESLTEILGGKGAGVLPMGRMTPEAGRPYYERATRPIRTRFGAVGERAAEELYRGYPREKPLTMEEIWKGEAEEAGELAGAARWWRETRPELMMTSLRNEALKIAMDEQGEFGGKWIEAKAERLGVPEWIENLTEEEKEGWGLVKDPKTGTYSFKDIGVSHAIQLKFHEMMVMDPPKLEEFNTQQRREIRIVTQGKRALTAMAGPETVPEWLQPFIEKPMAIMDKTERIVYCVALLNDMPTRQVRMIMDLIYRPSLQKITGLAEEQRTKPAGIKWPWSK